MLAESDPAPNSSVAGVDLSAEKDHTNALVAVCSATSRVGHLARASEYRQRGVSHTMPTRLRSTPEWYIKLTGGAIAPSPELFLD